MTGTQPAVDRFLVLREHAADILVTWESGAPDIEDPVVVIAKRGEPLGALAWAAPQRTKGALAFALISAFRLVQETAIEAEYPEIAANLIAVSPCALNILVLDGGATWTYVTINEATAALEPCTDPDDAIQFDALHLVLDISKDVCARGQLLADKLEELSRIWGTHAVAARPGEDPAVVMLGEHILLEERAPRPLVRVMTLREAKDELRWFLPDDLAEEIRAAPRDVLKVISIGRLGVSAFSMFPEMPVQLGATRP